MTQNKSLSESSSDRDIKNIIDKKFYLQNNLEIIADKYEYNFVNLKENICPDVCPIFIKNYPYTWDKFHFSKEFSGYISQLLRDELSPIFSGIQK